MKRTSKKLWILPILMLVVGLGLAYNFFPEFFGRGTVKLTVLDTSMNPVPHAKVKYRPLWTSFGPSGELETGRDGSVLWPVLRNNDVDCTITCDGYAYIRIRMDRSSDRSPWHQTQVKWVFLSHDPKGLTPHTGGEVVPDVDDANLMHLTVYLPKSRDEVIPPYGPHRIVHEENGQQRWTPVPSEVLKYW